MWALIALLSVLAIPACTNGRNTPDPGGAGSPELEARAIWRACSDVACLGAPILIKADVGDDVRAEIAKLSDEVRYVTIAEVETMAEPGARFPDGATLFGKDDARELKGPGIVGVDVSVSKGPGDFFAQTYLFEWNGAVWVDITSDAIGVTVTSAVS